MISIRPAVKSDTSQLASLYRDSIEHQQEYTTEFRTGPENDWSHHIEAMLGRNDTKVFVAEKSGALVGFLRVRILTQGYTSKRRRIKASLKKILFPKAVPPNPIHIQRRYGFIQDIYLTPCERRTAAGAALKLFNASLQWLKEQSIEVVEASASANNENIINLCSKLGFEPVEVTMRRQV